MPPKLIFDDAELARAVASSRSYWSVARTLRPARPRGIYKTMQRRVRELGLDTSHFTGLSPKPLSWTEAALREAIASSTSLSQVIRKLGLVAAGGNFDHVQRRIRELDIDISHLTGKGWRRGSRTSVIPARPLEEVLVMGRFTSSHHLKKRLFREGLKQPCCELCGWAEVAPDGRIPVELDHINGDRNDNRLVNLRILCPNCHSLQPTHRGLNQRRARLGVMRASDSRTLEWWPSSDSNRHLYPFKGYASTGWARGPQSLRVSDRPRNERVKA
jgi:hypothetical protein